MATNTTSSAKTSAAFKQLAESLGSAPPDGLSALAARDLQHLDAQVREALRVHQETLAEAEASIITQAPRPLRGTVRRILGA